MYSLLFFFDETMYILILVWILKIPFLWEKQWKYNILIILCSTKENTFPISHNLTPISQSFFLRFLIRFRNITKLMEMNKVILVLYLICIEKRYDRMNIFILPLCTTIYLMNFYKCIAIQYSHKIMTNFDINSS